MNESRRAATRRWLRSIAIFDCVAALLVVIVGLWRGWTTTAEFGLPFLIVGGAILAFGVLSLRSQKLLEDDGRSLANQQRIIGTVETFSHHNRLDLPQARSMMATLGTASLPLLAIGLLLRFVV